MRVSVAPGNAVPFVLQIGEAANIVMTTNGTARVSVPGEGIDEQLSKLSSTSYGGYAAQREVIVTVTSGRAHVTISPNGALPETANGNTIGQRGQLISSVSRGTYSLKPTGVVSQSSASALTRQQLVALPKPVVAVRLRLFEWYANTTGLRASLAWLADPADALTRPDAAHNRFTFGGSNTVNVNAPTTSTGITAAGVQYVESDVLQVGSIPVNSSVLVRGRNPGAIANIRVAQNAQAVSRYDYPANPQFSKSGFELSFVLNVDGVVSPSTYVSPTSALNGSAFELVGYTTEDTRTFMSVGASTVNGHLDDDGTALGVGARACSKITELNVVHVNMGWTGRSTENTINVGIEALARVKPTAAAISPWSVNDSDTGTAAGDARTLALAFRWIDACRANGVRPGFYTTQYAAFLNAQQNASRNNHNNLMRQICAAGFAFLIDLDAFYTPNNAWADPTWTPDNQHIGSVGLTAGELTFAPQFQRAVS